MNSEVKDSILKSKIVQEKCNAFVTILDNPTSSDGNSLIKDWCYNAKDMFSTKGILTTGSSNSLKDYVPFFDATVIKKLKEAGAILISKSASDEFGLGGTGTTCHTGAVTNPWDNTRIAGGSSAGAAVAVATGCVRFALGTDTGDSVRKPAAYCGVVGFKPTYGVISRYGVFPFAASLDHVGVLTRNVLDAALVTDVIKGKDVRDMTSLDNKDLAKQIDGNVKGKKLFYIKELCNLEYYENPNDELKETISKFHETLEKARKLGIEVCEESIDEKLLKALQPTYMVISCAEATSNLSMYTGIIYGPRGEGDKINAMVKDYRTKGFSPLIKRRLVIGSYVLQKENQDRYYLNACKVRRLVVDTFNNLFKKYDGFITMASGGAAPKLCDSSEVFTNKAVLENHLCIGNFGGYPSITIPNGFVNGMPIGINITGAVLDDGNVLNIAAALEGAMEYKNQVVGGFYE